MHYLRCTMNLSRRCVGGYLRWCLRRFITSVVWPTRWYKNGCTLTYISFRCLLMDIHCCPLLYQSEYGSSSSCGHANEEWNQGTQKCQNSNGSPRNSWHKGEREIFTQSGVQSRAYMDRLERIWFLCLLARNFFFPLDTFFNMLYAWYVCDLHSLVWWFYFIAI